MLARRARLSVFDEPEAGIDLWSFQNLIQVFRKLHDGIHGSSIIIISHQERIMEIADEIVVLSNGKVLTQGTREEVLPKLLGGTDTCHFCPREEGV